MALRGRPRRVSGTGAARSGSGFGSGAGGVATAGRSQSGSSSGAMDFPCSSSKPGGISVDTTLAVHTIVRLHADGSEAWRFSVEKLLSPSDWIEPPPALGDIDHPNSLTLDQNGNYIVSFRNAGEITSIDSASGRVLWRLGGAHPGMAADRSK